MPGVNSAGEWGVVLEWAQGQAGLGPGVSSAGEWVVLEWAQG